METAEAAQPMEEDISLEQELPSSQMDSSVSPTPAAGATAHSQSGRNSAGAANKSRVSISPAPIVDYKLGDVVWAHVQHYPWWPAIIAPDPKDGQYTQSMPARGGGPAQPGYHVLFFGPTPEHNWIHVRHLMPYTGRADYELYMEDLKAKAKLRTTDNKFYNSLKIKPHQKAGWESAVNEGDEASDEPSVDDRLEHWISVFFDKAARRAGTRTPRKSEAPPVVTEPVAEVATTETAPSVAVPADTKSAVKRRRKTGSPRRDLPADENIEDNVVSDAKPAATPGLERRESVAPAQKGKRPKKKVPLPASSNLDDDLIALTQLPSEPIPECDPEAQPEAAFRLFVQRNLRAVAHRYPTQAYGQLKTLLHNMWAKLSLAEKRKCLVSLPPKEVGALTEKSNKKVVEVVEDEDNFPPLPVPLPDQVEEYKEALGTYQLEVYRLTSLWAVRNQPVCGVCEKPGSDISETNGSQPLGSPPPATAPNAADEELIACTSQCARHFHRRCLSKMNETFNLPATVPTTTTVTCAECQTNRRTCFCCKKQELSPNTENGSEEFSDDDKQLLLCSVNRCGRFYHRLCASKMRLSRFENNTFTCPQHACATCAAAVEDPTSAESSRTGRMYRCVRCPVAYHVGDFCVAAGSYVLGFGPNIVCGDHLEPTASLAMLSSGSLASKTAAVSRPQNVTWCFTCGKSGFLPEDKPAADANNGPPQAGQPAAPPEKPLICCATCPAAYHRRCLPAAQAASSDVRFTCTDCDAGKRPLYGDIVWVKVGHYRWWPCEIYHPENLPPNIRKMKHGTGEFAVRFFGTGEFFWLGRGRCFHFQHGDTSMAPTSGHGALARLYNNSIIEGTKAFEEWTRFKERQMGTQRERANYKPVPFKYIKANYPIGNVEMPKMDLSEIPKCDCDINQSNPCGADSTCVNRLTQVECHSQVCNAGDQCCNQRFVKRLYAPAEPFRTATRGWGLRALAPIRQGQFVVEYVGDLIDDDEHRHRVDEAKLTGETNFYFLTLDRCRIIDAGPKGNLSRFMNHSCQPSCETQKWLVNGDLRVGLFALRDIAAGEELTFNYNCDESNEDHLLDKQPCRCGAPDCRGLIGGSKPNGGNGEKGSKQQSSKLSRRARQSQKAAAFRASHDDECFQCGEPGRLVLCDRPRCPKAYHVGCLGQDKPPSGRFICPWHHCSVCWKPSTQLCAFCPHSYCAEHSKPNHISERMSVSMGPLWVCTGHNPKEVNDVLNAPPTEKPEKAESS